MANPFLSWPLTHQLVQDNLLTAPIITRINPYTILTSLQIDNKTNRIFETIQTTADTPLNALRLLATQAQKIHPTYAKFLVTEIKTFITTHTK